MRLGNQSGQVCAIVPRPLSRALWISWRSTATNVGRSTSVSKASAAAYGDASGARTAAYRALRQTSGIDGYLGGTFPPSVNTPHCLTEHAQYDLPSAGTEKIQPGVTRGPSSIQTSLAARCAR
jgi:hypothetical protein